MTRNPVFALGLAAAMALSVSLAQAQANKQASKPVDNGSQSFISAAIKHNYAEIDVGKLAQEKGQSEGVKAFGARLVKDHSESNEKAKAVAKELGLTPPTGADLTHQAGYLKLKVLSGASFDKSFARSMVTDHEADIKEFQKQAQKSDPAGAFAKETLPTLREHFAMAQKLTEPAATTGSAPKKK
jgi:putative membrane protein